MKYTTKVTRFDVADGTEITKQQEIDEYIVIKTRQEYKQITHEHIERSITRECEKKRQLRLF